MENRNLKGNRISRSLGSILILFAIGFSMAGCEQPFPARDEQTPAVKRSFLKKLLGAKKPSKPGLPDPLVLGAVLELTGPGAPYGQWSKKGLDLAVDDLKAKGVNVRLIIEDGQSDPKMAVAAYTKLATVDKVPVVITTTISGSVMACAPIAERNQVILFAPGSSSPEITKAGDYVFRNRISGIYETEKAAELAYKQLGITRMVMLLVNNDFGLSYGDAFQKIYEQAGGAIVAKDTFASGATDFRVQLTKLKALEYKGIFLVGQVAECGYVLKQAKELGIKTQWISTIGVENSKLIEIAGDAAEGLIYTAPRYELDDMGTSGFEQKYFERFQEHSNLYAANSYDALNLLVNAIRSAGYTGAGIKDALYKTKDYPGVSGLTTFDANGDVVKPVVLKMVKGGKFVSYEAAK